jgi:hypothetical protein
VPLRITPSNWNCTLATPWLAVAFAATRTVRVMVELFAGAVIEIVGAVPCARVKPNRVRQPMKRTKRGRLCLDTGTLRLARDQFAAGSLHDPRCTLQYFSYVLSKVLVVVPKMYRTSVLTEFGPARRKYQLTPSSPYLNEGSVTS